MRRLAGRDPSAAAYQQYQLIRVVTPLVTDMELQFGEAVSLLLKTLMEQLGFRERESRHGGHLLLVLLGASVDLFTIRVDSVVR